MLCGTVRVASPQQGAVEEAAAGGDGAAGDGDGGAAGDGDDGAAGDEDRGAAGDGEGGGAARDGDGGAAGVQQRIADEMAELYRSVDAAANVERMSFRQMLEKKITLDRRLNAYCSSRCSSLLPHCQRIGTTRKSSLHYLASQACHGKASKH